MQQRTDEWIEQCDYDYHEKQFQTPYRSTVNFVAWLESCGRFPEARKQRILDVGTGQGANVYYLAKQFPWCEFVGIDIHKGLIQKGNEILKKESITNAALQTVDLYQLNSAGLGNFDGLVSFQTLSWLPGYEEALAAMLTVNPKWLALSSLFHDGQVSCQIKALDHTKSDADHACRESFYNVYSRVQVEGFLKEHGYGGFKLEPFEMDVDLSKPDHGGMGTYTEKLIDGRRLQISGPLLMPWHFLLVERL